VKWMVLVLVTALVLIAAGLMFGHRTDTDSLSENDEAQALCEEGTADYNALRLHDAVNKLGQSLELDPALAEASIARSLAFARLGQTDNFETELDRADSLTALLTDPRRRMLAELRLSALSMSRYYTMGDSVLAALEQEIPNNIFVLVAKASQPDIMTDPVLQEKAWQRILEVDPNFANSYNMLGYLELHRGNYDQSIEYMKKYAFLAPDQANPHDSMGEVLMVMGRYEEAEQEFIKSVKIQPDFYFSLINLGSVYLHRGQIAKGKDILEKVRAEVRGSTLERQVDLEIINAFVNSDLDEEMDRMAAEFIARYPDERVTCFYRAMRLAAVGDPDAGRAVMDSCLTDWRKDAAYAGDANFRRNIENAQGRFEAISADYNAAPAERVTRWKKALDQVREVYPFHYQWFYRYRLAKALRESGRPDKALAELRPMFEVNPRQINALELAAYCSVDLGDRAGAQTWLSLLQRSLKDADPDFYGRERAATLATRIGEMPTGM